MSFIEENGGRWGEIGFNPPLFIFFRQTMLAQVSWPLAQVSWKFFIFFAKFLCKALLFIVIICISLLNPIITYNLRQIQDIIQEYEQV